MLFYNHPKISYMKSKLLLSTCLFIYMKLTAQVAGPNNPTASSNVDLPGYSQQWIDITNVQIEDESYASFGNLPKNKFGSYTDYLAATDFGFLIPSGTNIYGIKVEVKCSDPNSRTSDYSVRLIKNGIITGDDKAVGTPYPTEDNYITYGGSTDGGPADLWGETWDNNIINNNDFGVAIAAKRNVNDDVITAGQVDFIKITVYYGFITLPVTLTSFTARMQSKTVLLNWKTASENSINNYKVERSADGRNFNPITSIAALNIADANYNYFDNYPLPGVSYYRLNIQGMAGYQKYSQIVSVKYNKENSLSLYPSAWNKGVDLNVNNDTNEKLIIYFFNAGGQVICTVTTQSKLVPTETLGTQKGLTPYKIYNSKMELTGSGRIVIL